MKDGQDHATFVDDQSPLTHRNDEEPSDSSPLASSDQGPGISALQEIDEEPDSRATGLVERLYNFRETNWWLWEPALLIISVLLVLVIPMVFPDPVVSHISNVMFLIRLVGALR
jgi:hypothetical protein